MPACAWVLRPQHTLPASRFPGPKPQSFNQHFFSKGTLRVPPSCHPCGFGAPVSIGQHTHKPEEHSECESRWRRLGIVPRPRGSRAWASEIRLQEAGPIFSSTPTCRGPCTSFPGAAQRFGLEIPAGSKHMPVSHQPKRQCLLPWPHLGSLSAPPYPSGPTFQNKKKSATSSRGI